MCSSMSLLRGLLMNTRIASRSVRLKTEPQKLVCKFPRVAVGSPYLLLSSSYSSPPQPSRDNRKDLYAILGVSPHATQQQIKEAYYRLSMKYHPDKNRDSQLGHARFTELTDAYSVLGSHNLRRKYDKGLLHEYPSHGTEDHRGSHGSQRDAYTSSAMQGEKTKFNFDEFYRAHYGEALKREQEERKSRQAAKEKAKLYSISQSIQQVLIITVVVSVLVVGWYGNSYLKPHTHPLNRTAYPADKS